jgi:hypothetical protein
MGLNQMRTWMKSTIKAVLSPRHHGVGVYTICIVGLVIVGNSVAAIVNNASVENRLFLNWPASQSHSAEISTNLESTCPVILEQREGDITKTISLPVTTAIFGDPGAITFRGATKGDPVCKIFILDAPPPSSTGNLLGFGLVLKQPKEALATQNNHIQVSFSARSEWPMSFAHSSIYLFDGTKMSEALPIPPLSHSTTNEIKLSMVINSNAPTLELWFRIVGPNLQRSNQVNGVVPIGTIFIKNISIKSAPS